MQYDVVPCPKCRGQGSEPIADSKFSAPMCSLCLGAKQINRAATCGGCGHYAPILMKEIKEVTFCGREACSKEITLAVSAASSSLPLL